jgi:hypothetical protein
MAGQATPRTATNVIEVELAWSHSPAATALASPQEPGQRHGNIERVVPVAPVLARRTLVIVVRQRPDLAQPLFDPRRRRFRLVALLRWTRWRGLAETPHGTLLVRAPPSHNGARDATSLSKAPGKDEDRRSSAILAGSFRLVASASIAERDTPGWDEEEPSAATVGPLPLIVRSERQQRAAGSRSHLAHCSSVAVQSTVAQVNHVGGSQPSEPAEVGELRPG